MDYLVPLWVRQYLTQRQRREIPEDVADHLLAICAEALQDRDPATLSHPRTHSIYQSFAAILRQKSKASISSTPRSKFPFGSNVATFRKLSAMDLDPLNSQEIVRLAIYVMKRSTLEFVDPLTSERVHTEGELKNNLFRVRGGKNNNNNTASGFKTGGLAAASDIYLSKDFHIGQNVLHNSAVPVSRAVQSALSLALFCARASGLRSKNEPPPSAAGNSYPLTAAASIAGAKWLAKLGQVMFGGPCSQAGHSHHRRTRASLELLERQNIELGHKILEEQKQAGLIDPKSGQTTIRRPSVVQSTLTPPDTGKAQPQGGGNKDLGGSSSSSDFVPLSSLSNSTSASTLSTTSGASSTSGRPGLEKWCRHCSRAMSCLVLAQLQETLGGLEEVTFDDSGFAGAASLSNSGFELLNNSSRSSSSSSLSKMDMPSQSHSSMASSFMGASGESIGSGYGRHRGYRDPRPHLEHKSDLLSRTGSDVAADRPSSPFILFDRSHVQDEDEPPSSIPSPLLKPSSERHSALALSLADAFGSEMATGPHGRAMQPQMNSGHQNESGPGQQSEGEGSPIQFKKFTQSKSNSQDTDLEMVSRLLGNDSQTSSGHSTTEDSHPLQRRRSRAVSTSSREEWERMVVDPQKTRLELDLEQAVADSTPVMASSTTAAAAVGSPVSEMPSVKREPIVDAKEESRAKDPLVGLGLDQGLSHPANMSSTEHPEENRSPVTPVSAEDELNDDDEIPVAGDSPSAAAGTSPVSPATEVAADQSTLAQDEDQEGRDEAVPKNDVDTTVGGENPDDRADVTQEEDAKPSGSPSSSTSSSPSSSSSSSSSDSSVSSFRSATQPNSPVSEGGADDDHRNSSSGSDDLDPTSRPHTPGEYSPSPQPLQAIVTQRKDEEEESSDEDIDVEIDDEEEDENKHGTLRKTPGSSSSSSSSSPTTASPKAPATTEHRPFYVVGLHGQASTDSYAREIEESITRKTPPQDFGRASRRGSQEPGDNNETFSSSSRTADENKETAAEEQEKSATLKEQHVNEEGAKDTSAATVPKKEILTLKELPRVAITEDVRSAFLEEKKPQSAKDATAPIKEETSTKSDHRPLSSISSSSSLLSEDLSLTSSSLIRDEEDGQDDSEHSSDELDVDEDYLNHGDDDGDGFISDLSGTAMASSSSLLSSSSSLHDASSDPNIRASTTSDQKRQKQQQRRKKRLLVDDAKRKQEQLDKIKAQLELKTLGKIRQQVSFWEEKGVLEQKVVGVVEVEDEPSEESSLTSKQTKQDSSRQNEAGHDDADHKAEKVPSSAPPTAPQRN